jgi:thiol-disulfide isomerase/thioredoxin
MRWLFKFTFLLILLLSTLLCKLSAQGVFQTIYKADEEQIAVGQKVPDFTVNRVFNFTSPTIHLHEFKGKSVILDFWATNCLSCVESLPLLDSLQEEFASKLQIVLVDYEPWRQIKGFFDKRKQLISMPHLPFVTSDTILLKYFPKNALPLDVWIDKNDTVRFITHGLDREEIRKFLEGIKLKMHQVKYVSDFALFKPLFQQPSNKWTKAITYYSYISHYVEGADIGNANKLKVNGGRSVRLSQYCKSISQLYAIAFGKGAENSFFEHSGSVILDVQDPSIYVWPKRGKDLYPWADHYCYDYDLCLPVGKASQVFTIMQQDITRYFNLKGDTERREIPCWVLIRTGSMMNAFSREIVNHSPNEYYDSLLYYDMPFSQFGLALKGIFDRFFTREPFVNTVHHSGIAHIVLHQEGLSQLTYDNVTELNKDLQKYGLKVVKRDFQVPVLVLTE